MTEQTEQTSRVAQTLLGGDEWSNLVAAVNAEDWAGSISVAKRMIRAKPDNLDLRVDIAREFRRRWGSVGIDQVKTICDEADAEAEAVKKISPPLQPEADEPELTTRLEAVALGLDPDSPAWFVKREAARRAKAQEAQPAPKIEQTEQAEQTEQTEQAKSASANAKATATALTVIEQPKPATEVIPANETPEETAVREMNDKHAVISNLGGKCVIMEWVPSAISEGQKELSYQSFQAFRERYANHYIDVPSGRGRWNSAPFAPIWLTHPHRRQYEGLDLVPNGPAILPNGYLNLWRGWGVEPRKGSWKLMQRHIAEVLANGDQVFEDFILRLTAWKFQNPGVRPEVVLALLGGKGAGKGAWGYIQMLIYGPHGLQIFSTDHLIGKHNQHLQNKLFLFLDEAVWAGDTDADRVLKGLTTEKWMFIEPKKRQC
jgi:hypothetical protein